MGLPNVRFQHCNNHIHHPTWDHTLSLHPFIYPTPLPNVCLICHYRITSIQPFHPLYLDHPRKIKKNSTFNPQKVDFPKTRIKKTMDGNIVLKKPMDMRCCFCYRYMYFYLWVGKLEACNVNQQFAWALRSIVVKTSS